MKDPSETQIADLERNLADSRAAFESVRDRHELADRALAGVRGGRRRAADRASGPEPASYALLLT